MICNKNLCHYDVAPKATVIIVDCKDVTAAKISNVSSFFECLTISSIYFRHVECQDIAKTFQIFESLFLTSF